MHADTKGALSSTARHAAQIGLNEGLPQARARRRAHTSRNGQFVEYSLVGHLTRETQPDVSTQGAIRDGATVLRRRRWIHVYRRRGTASLKPDV